MGGELSMLFLNEKAQNALKKLYDINSGILFDNLGIDNQTFFYLVENEYISEPQGKIFNVYGANEFPQIIHDGFVVIEPKGRGYVEALLAMLKKETQENKRYVITTAIAGTALLMSIVSIILGVT